MPISIKYVYLIIEQITIAACLVRLDSFPRFLSRY